MPKSSREKPIYQRGGFALYRRPDRPNLEIVWYDAEKKRERSASAGTADTEAAKLALDRKFLAEGGTRVCPACNRPLDEHGSPLLADAIGDYLILREETAGIKATRGRLAHVLDYLAETDVDVTCAMVDRDWVERFRKWLRARPVVSPKGKFTRARSLGHVEGCVLQLAAAINATPGQRATFSADQPRTVSDSPTYRASVEKLAEMFRFALLREDRINLLTYLRIATATWARPDAIYDLTDKQWLPEARVLDLNPAGRRQTRKYRPKVPVARQLVPLLDQMTGNYLPVTTIRHGWAAMSKACKLPGDRQAGEKLVRRSMATLVRKRIGEERWRQGEMMLGHVKASVSDIYAIPDPANLGLALAATEEIIDEIEALAPGAYRNLTAKDRLLKVVNGGKN